MKDIRSVMVANNTRLDDIFERSQLSIPTLATSTELDQSMSNERLLEEHTKNLTITERPVQGSKQDITSNKPDKSRVITCTDTLMDSSKGDHLRKQILSDAGSGAEENGNIDAKKAAAGIPSTSNGNAVRIERLIRAIEAENAAKVEELLAADVGKELDVRGADGFTPLIAAAKLNMCPVIMPLLEYGAWVDFTDGNLNSTALQWAADKGHVDVIELLLAHEADIHVKNDTGKDAVSYAGTFGREQAMIALLERGADPESGGHKDGSRLIHWAAHHGLCDAIQVLIRKGADMQAKITSGANAIHIAVEKKQLLACRLLIKSGVDLEAKAERFYTPLHYAVIFADAEITKLLLQKGASRTAVGRDGFIPLHEAALRGKPDSLAVLLRSSESVDVRTPTGRTALHLATAADEVQAARVLLSRGADCKAVDDDGYMPLHRAAQIGSLKIVELLVLAGALIMAPTAKEDQKHTALHRAALSGHKDIVGYLLDRGALIDSKDCVDQQTPLHSAARQGHMDLVEYLIGRKASITARAENGYNLLHSAAMSGNVGMINLFISAGLSIDSQTQTLLTPLHIAAQRGHAEAVQTLLAKGASASAKDVEGVSAIHSAGDGGSAECINILLTVGKCSVREKDNGWSMPLHYAAWSGHVPALEILIRNKAPLEVVNKHDQTPLIGAAGNGHVEAIKFLLSKGAKLEAKFGIQPTALGFAVLGNHLPAVEFLLEQGARIDTVSGEYGGTDLHLAASEPGISGVIAGLLLDHGIDINALSREDGCTPLMDAAAIGAVEVATVLLERGAELELQGGEQTYGINNAGTALAHAITHEHLEIVKLLLERGANVDKVCTGEHRLRPLHLAAMSGNIEIVTLLLKYGAPRSTISKDGRLPQDFAKVDEIRSLLRSPLEETERLWDSVSKAASMKIL